VILFASPRYDFPPLLQALDAACRPRVLIGSSSAGEFTTNVNGEGMACAVALRAHEMQFTAGVGRRLGVDRPGAVQQVVSSFAGLQRHDFAFRFQRRFVFCGTEAIPDAVVALEILSNKPLGIGVRHGWLPAGEPLRVAEAEGMRLGSLNAVEAGDVFEEHAERTGQLFDRDEPFPFFLHNVPGVETGAGHKLRVPLSVNADRSVQCATEVPAGSAVRIMSVSTAAAARAGESTREAVSQQEQMSGFHNCTAVVCVFPE
jgi:hypothetical protein